MNNKMKTSPAADYYLAQLANPLTAFLDHVRRGQDLLDDINKALPLWPDESVRGFPVVKRLRLNARVANFHIALGHDREVADEILDLLEVSYASRNPTPQVIAKREQVAKDFVKSVKELGATNSLSQAVGRCIIGTPGSGKTSSTSTVLGHIPQVVEIDTQAYPHLLSKMITWIRVETPGNRKISALADNIITAIGLAAGEKLPGLKKGNISAKLQNVAMLCMDLQVGVIVIDEIQHILRKSNEPDTELLNFLVELSNRMSIPLLLIGTPQAEFVVAGALRQARRMIGPHWEPMKRGSESWKSFSTRLLGYQFTRQVAPDTELEPTLHELSQGLPAIAVTLFQLAQRAALVAELESKRPTKITAVLLQAAFDRYMQAVAPMLSALRSGDEVKIALFQDLKVDAKTLEAVLIDRTAERNMRVAQKLMRIRMGVSKQDKLKWRKDAN